MQFSEIVLTIKSVEPFAFRKLVYINIDFALNQYTVKPVLNS